MTSPPLKPSTPTLRCYLAHEAAQRQRSSSMLGHNTARMLANTMISHPTLLGVWCFAGQQLAEEFDK
jgi:hypothetical protein